MTNKLRDQMKSDHKPRVAWGKRICPWCGRRVSLRKGTYPSHVHPHITNRLCPGAFQPYKSRRERRRPLGVQQPLFRPGGTE